MNKEKFNDGFKRLQEAFGHSRKGTAQIFWDRLMVYSDADWLESVEFIIDNEERFPTIAHLRKRVELIAVNRREGDQQQREQAASRRKPGSSTGIAEVIASIPFPPELKALLTDKIAGKINQEQLEAGVKAWEKKNPPDRLCHANCEDGLVHYRKEGNSYTGTCNRCKRGPKSYPLVDPSTCEAYQATKQYHSA